MTRLIEPQILTPQRTHWIFDVDGVLHSYEGIPDVMAFFAQVKLKTLRDDFHMMTDDEIIGLGKKSYLETGDGLHLYSDHAVQTRIIANENKDLFREGLLRRFHRKKLQATQEGNLDLLQGCSQTNDFLSKLNNAGIGFSFLTQSCRRHWAEPVLQSRGLLEHFNRYQSLDFHEIGYQTKKLSYSPIEQAVKATDLTPDKIVFIEDSADNLVTAKKRFPTLLTVLISKTPVSGPAASFIDRQAEDLKMFLQDAQTVYNPRTNAPAYTPG